MQRGERGREGGGGGMDWSAVAMHPQCVTGLSMVCCYEKSPCARKGANCIICLASPLKSCVSHLVLGVKLLWNT